MPGPKSLGRTVLSGRFLGILVRPDKNPRRTKIPVTALSTWFGHTKPWERPRSYFGHPKLQRKLGEASQRTCIRKNRCDAIFFYSKTGTAMAVPAVPVPPALPCDAKSHRFRLCSHAFSDFRHYEAEESTQGARQS